MPSFSRKGNFFCAICLPLICCAISWMVILWNGDFFSKNYKMGRQRKNVDKNIQNIIETLDREIEDKIKEIIPKIRNQMETIIKELEMPLNQIKKIKEILSSTNNEIKKIKEKID